MYDMKDSHLTIYKYFTKHQLGMTSVVSKGDKLYCILYTRFIFEVINKVLNQKSNLCFRLTY